MSEPRTVPLASSFLSSVLYDAANLMMTVTFRDGRTYTFEGVDQATADAFTTSPSPSRFFNQELKGRY